MRDDIAVDHRSTILLEQRGNGTLAAADAAGQSDNQQPVLITSDLAGVF